MKILLVTGTTPFPSLIKRMCDIASQGEFLYLTIQTLSETNIDLPNVDQLKFIKGQRYWEEFDFIVCHGGAGTIFSLLNGKAKFIAVPNTDRGDSHQVEICEWLSAENLALSCSVDELTLEMIYSEHLSEVERNFFQKSTFNVEKLISYFT